MNLELSIQKKKNTSKSELSSSSGSLGDLTALSGEPHGACSYSQPCKLVNEHSSKCNRGAASGRQRVSVPPVWLPAGAARSLWAEVA